MRVIKGVAVDSNCVTCQFYKAQIPKLVTATFQQQAKKAFAQHIADGDHVYGV